jgi:hypothetical protein
MKTKTWFSVAAGAAGKSYRRWAIGAVTLLLAMRVGTAAEVAVPGYDSGLQDPVDMRAKALAAESREDWNAALACWERVIDRLISSQAQLDEAFKHILDFRAKVKPLNSDPKKARAWRTLVVIFKTLNAQVETKAGNKEVFASRFTQQEIDDIHARVEGFCKYVFEYTDGILRIEPEYLVMEEPLKELKGQSPYTFPPEIVVPLIRSQIGDKPFDHTMVYVKFRDDNGKGLPAPFTAGTSGGDKGPNGSSIMEFPYWKTGGGPGAIGEVELHEWLHPVDMIFTDILGYPAGVTRNPDTYGQDPVFRKPAGKGLITFYEYMMRCQTTRLMWSELAMREPEHVFWGGSNLKDWLVIGPFEAKGKDAMDVDFVGEATLRPEEGAEAGGKKWIHSVSRNGMVDLAQVLGNATDAVAYLATAVRSAGKRNVDMGSSGGMKAWANGQLIHGVGGKREFKFNTDTVKMTLEPGFSWNLFVFKVQNVGGQWKFQARLRNQDGTQPWGARFALPSAENRPKSMP